MHSIDAFIGNLNGVLFSDYTVYALLAVGLLFTVWSFFGQYRALTHGVSVVRGKYDDHNDPGAINHFQALSAALSATVGLGNIAGVAVAVALGGPGAVLWMWLIGLLGMALKMTEVTQSMLYRNTDDPENPHGGPMFVVAKGLAESAGLRMFGGVLFAATTLGLSYLAAGVFGSNLAWIPGGLLALVFLVLGFMKNKGLGLVVGGIFVVTLIISAITGGNMFQAWNVADITFTYFAIPQAATGVVLTILVGLVIIGGIKRIGSVAGRIVPFMCVLYVLAALYVLAVNFDQIPAMFALIVKSGLPGGNPDATGAFLGGTFGYAAMWGVKRALFSSEAGQGSSPIAHSAAKTDEPVREGVVAGLEPFVDTIVVCTLTALVILSSGAYNRGPEAVFEGSNPIAIVQAVDAEGQPIPDTWTAETPDLPRMNAEGRKIRRSGEGESGWRDGEKVFLVVNADVDPNTGREYRRIFGVVSLTETEIWTVKWGTLESESKPTLRENADGSLDTGIYGDYAGASLTAYAFDRVTPGLGMWLITIAAWLFAVSTMISWSYYGEQGIYFFCGRMGPKAAGSIALIYKVIYSLLILVTTALAMPIFGSGDNKFAIIATDHELDNWTTLGLGVMLVANVPIMLVFSGKAMGAFHGYFGRMKHGGDDAHSAPPITEVVEGKDIK
jgi:AGCS family alanine or glycine:cation symporter